MAELRLRRSALYMPGANARALDKAREIDCDALIFDLEDAVAVDAKATARDQVQAALAVGGYGHRERVVRVNGLDTEWGAADVHAFADADVDALLFPKVESPAQVAAIVEQVDAAGGAHLPLWIMVETPVGVLDVRPVLGSCERIRCVVMGTSDLVKELRAQHTVARDNLYHALQHCVLAARAAGVDILDGVHLDFRNAETFLLACEQGRAMGFDGKTLIHPTQVAGANEVFGFGAQDVAHAQRVLQVWQQAQAQGKGVAVLDGQLVENLHAADAQRVLAFAAALTDRG